MVRSFRARFWVILPPSGICKYPTPMEKVIWLATVAVFLPLAALAFRGARWAYFTFVALSLLFFPVRVAFRLQPRACDLGLDVPLALISLRNYPHIALFGIFFLMTGVQTRRYRAGVQMPIAGAAVLAMGACVELAQGLTGYGHCRLGDLLPDAAGALLEALVWTAWRYKNAGAAESSSSEG
jgi:hypothetical protein